MPKLLLLVVIGFVIYWLVRGLGAKRRPTGTKKAVGAEVPYLLEVRTRGDVPMPRTGYWDIANFLRLGND